MVAGVVLGLSLVDLAVRPQWSDQTWLLYVANRLLDGARLGSGDVAEPNPPLIIWMSEIPAWIGRALDVPLPTALQACVAALVAVSASWSANLLRRQRIADNRRFARWFTVALLFATVIHPWVFYGQREHIMLLLVLPYLLMAAGRIEGQGLPVGEAAVAGLCAGLGFLLKPHHLLVILAVEGLVLVRGRHVRSLYRPEMAAMVATGFVYIAAVWLLAPDYVREVLPLALGTYNDYHLAVLSELILPERGLKLAIIVLLWLVLHRWLAHRGLSSVFLVAAIGATLAYLVQRKGHQYQFVPAIAFFDLLLGVMAIDCWLKWTAGRAAAIPRGLAAAGGILIFIATIVLCYPAQLTRAAHTYTDERAEILRAVGQGIPTNSTVLILSTSAESFFEQVLDGHWQWGSRFMCLWMLPAIFTAEHAASLDGTVPPAAMRSAAALTRDVVAADLARWKPNPVLVERCQDTSVAPCRGLSLRQDIVQWLEQDSGFAAAWSDYVREGQDGPYDLWCRKGETETCRRILAGPEAALVKPLEAASDRPGGSGPAYDALSGSPNRNDQVGPMHPALLGAVAAVPCNPHSLAERPLSDNCVD
jgi:hypothetical protein